MRAGRQAEALIVSSPPRPLTVSCVAGLGAGDVHRGRQAGDRDAAAAEPVTLMLSSPLVPLTMTVSAGRRRAAARRRQVEVDLASRRCRSGR